MLKEGDRVRADLGAEGVVEMVETGRNGETLILIRWKTGVLGAYNPEEVSRYKIVRSTS
jgi:hypothetical protein